MEIQDGVLLINKPVGITSFDVIRKLRRIFTGKVKMGHAGTLDPFASGLLIILVGRGTKMMNDILKFSKVYEAEAKFGVETDTLDTEGKVVIEDKDFKGVDDEKLKAVLEGFVGSYMQTPPAYSAKKIKGKKAYELARAGKKVEIPPREVDILDMKLNFNEVDKLEFGYECKVSSGTYIRVLTKDIASKIDTVANTYKLVRTHIGPYSLEDAIEINEETTEELTNSLIIPI